MHESDADAPIAAVEVSVLERTPQPHLAERVRSVLLADGLVGLVHPFDSPGEALCSLVVDASGLAARVGPTGLEGALALDTVAARLSRALDAAVLIDVSMLLGPRPALPSIAEETGAIAVDLPGFDAGQAAEERALAAERAFRTISLVRLPADAVRSRLPELALSVGEKTVVVPDGGRSLVVTDGGGLPQWWKAAMPVVSMVVGPSSIALLATTRTRCLGADIPLTAYWGERAVGIQPDGVHPEARRAQAALHDDLPMPAPDASLVDALGWTQATVDALRALPTGERPDPSMVVAAIGGPPAMVRLAEGGDAALEPGAIAFVPDGTRATLLDAMALAVEPAGDTAWSRWALWWWRRPALSIGAGIAMLAFTVLVIGRMATTDDAPWWRIALAVGVALNGIGILSTGLLARHSRRDRASRSSSRDAA